MKSRRYLRSVLIALAGWPAVAPAANITWTGGDGTWTEGAANNVNWNPADEPDSTDAAIFNTANIITLASTNTINGLTVSAGADLLLAGNSLTVNGPATVGGSGSRLELTGAGSVFNGQNLTINSGGNVFLDGGTLNLEIAGTTNASLTIASGGILSGNGTIAMNDPVSAVRLIDNNGTITASNPSPNLLIAPSAATLLIDPVNDLARIDLDGSLETGNVNIFRSQTLNLDLDTTDDFNGTIEMAHGSKLGLRYHFTLGTGAALNVDNGATSGIPSLPASTSEIIGNNILLLTDGAINLEDNDGTLRLAIQFLMLGGSFVNNGHVIFERNTDIRAGANFSNVGPTAGITVRGASDLIIEQPDFDLDSLGTVDSFITVENNSSITARLGDYDPDVPTNTFSSTINLLNGDFDITTGDAEFVMNGTLNMHASNTGGITIWSGEPFDLGNDLGTNDARLNVTGSRISQFDAQVDFNSDANVNIAAGATLDFDSLVNFDTVNVSNNAVFTGAGTMSFSGAVNVNELATINMTGGTVDLDGLDTVGDFVNIDAPFVINAAQVAAFGRVNNSGGINTLDINHSVGAGTLTVNLDNPADEWTLNAQGVMNLVNDNSAATLLAGNAVNLNGTVNVTGEVRTNARVDISGNVNLNTANEPFRLSGGNLSTAPNRLLGGTISGAGRLKAESLSALNGFGTINSAIDFDLNSYLIAEDGTLTVNGAFLNLFLLSARVGGILNVPNAWNSGNVTVINHTGGIISGGTITLDNEQGIRGLGTVSSKVINNTLLEANVALDSTVAPAPLLLQTAANDNDWDGTANTGTLSAINSSVLELHDTADFPFSGVVSASFGGTVKTVGFALDLEPASSLSLSNGTLESDRTLDIGGSVTVSGTQSKLSASGPFRLIFESGSNTVLNGNLRLECGTADILAGAAFAGSGALIIDADTATMAANVNANVFVVNDDSILRIGGVDGVGRVDVRDFQQTAGSDLIMEMRGTALNEYDRLLVNGSAQISGALTLDIDGSFVPAVGQSFVILNASAGVSGQFDQINVSGLPAGVTFAVSYQANSVTATIVGGSQYDLWIASFPSLTDPADRLKFADPDDDGVGNLMEFALGSNPTLGNGTPTVFHRIASVDGAPAFTMTVPLRDGGGIAGITPMQMRDSESVYKLFVEASDDLVTFALPVGVVSFSDEQAILATLPAPPVGYSYLVFRSPGPIAGDPREFMRLRITE